MSSEAIRVEASVSIIRTEDLPRFVQRRDAFLAVIVRDDELGMIVRTHILVESMMLDIIRRNLPNGADYNPGKFEARNRLVRAMGIIDYGGYKASEELNYLRNHFGHGVDGDIVPLSLGKVNEFERLILKSGVVYIKSHKTSESDLIARLRHLLVSIFSFWMAIYISEDAVMVRQMGLLDEKRPRVFGEKW